MECDSSFFSFDIAVAVAFAVTVAVDVVVSAEFDICQVNNVM